MCYRNQRTEEELIHIDRCYKNISRLTLTLGLIAVFGAPLCAETWYFQDTTLVGTRSGDATVTGFVTLSGQNWAQPTDITLTGPFGTFTDLGVQLQLDEGDTGWSDGIVDFGASLHAATPGLTVDPLIFFIFTSNNAGNTFLDTYSLVSGELTTVNPTPEPGTAPLMLVGALALGAGFKLRRS
jgi:hypothetical protein